MRLKHFALFILASLAGVVGGSALVAGEAPRATRGGSRV